MIRFVVALLFLLSDSRPMPAIVPQNPDAVLTLQWNKAYPDDTVDKSAIGLQWALSYIGARLPNGPDAMLLKENQVAIDLNEMGFDAPALEKLIRLHRKIKASEEYKQTKAIDLGRYIALLLGAPEHYYAIVGIPPRLEELLAGYTLTAETGYVNNSNVSLKHRKIQYSEQNGLNQLLISEETDPVTGEILEYETVEIMPNGQVKFGIFDASGNRKNYAESSHSAAGKPAKCMWCHESTISKMFNAQQNVSGFLTYDELQKRLTAFNDALTVQKKALTGGVNFAELQQHTLTELAYISFMEPSAERLALEWKMPVEKIKKRLAGLPVHEHEEFPFLGQLYDRNAVEKRAPYLGLPVSTSVREQSVVEVNHLN